MHSDRHRRRYRALGAIAAGTLLIVVAALLPTPADAVEQAELYTAQVPLDSASPDAREAAYRQALQQILIRITGTEDAALSPELNELFPNPSRYVLQFRPGENSTLHVAMDGAAIERLVRQTGFPVWDKDRPLTVIWLAVDWGRGDRELIAAGDTETPVLAGIPASRDSVLREQVKSIARLRGVPVVFPALDADEAETVPFSDVWGGFHEKLLQASRRYGARAVLVGRLRPDVMERNRWSFYYADQQRQWSGEPDEVIHLLADTLAGQLAYAGNAPREHVVVTISGIDSVRAYGAVEQLMAGLNGIEDYAIDSVAGNSIRYRIEFNGGTSRLQSALAFSGKLVPASGLPASVVDPRDAATAVLEYVYTP